MYGNNSNVWDLHEISQLHVTHRFPKLKYVFDPLLGSPSWLPSVCEWLWVVSIYRCVLFASPSSLTHLHIPEGSCCAVCESCTYNHRIYGNGQRFVTPDQPCHVCTCQVSLQFVVLCSTSWLLFLIDHRILTLLAPERGEYCRCKVLQQRVCGTGYQGIATGKPGP